MASSDPEMLEQVVVAVPSPPFWYGWALKVLLAATAFLASLSLAAAVFYLAPAVRNLSEDTATEKKQDACYDQYTSDVTDGNATTLSALAAGQSAIGDLVNALAAIPRDPAVIGQAVNRVAASARDAIEASRRYDVAIADRAKYVADGRPLPCTNLPN